MLVPDVQLVVFQAGNFLQRFAAGYVGERDVLWLLTAAGVCVFEDYRFGCDGGVLGAFDEEEIELVFDGAQRIKQDAFLM